MVWFKYFISRLLAAYQKTDLPGKYWLYQKGKARFGRFLIEHHTAVGRFWVPWDQWCFWLEYGPENYYLHEFIPFCEHIDKLPGEVAFFDLGADIGVVSMVVASHCRNIKRLIAVEPNPNAYAILEQNMQSIRASAQTIFAAVSNYEGQAHLVFESDLGSDHEGHIDVDTEGETRVTTVDAIATTLETPLPSSVVLKVDVEGQEINALEGARNTIQQAGHLIVFLEIHPDVLERDNIRPEALLEAAEAIREFDWVIPGMGNLPLRRDVDFYQQVPRRQYDVIGIAR